MVDHDLCNMFLTYLDFIFNSVFSLKIKLVDFEIV